MKIQIIPFLLIGAIILSGSTATTTVHAAEDQDIPTIKTSAVPTIADIVITDSLEESLTEDAITEITATTIDSYVLGSTTVQNEDANIAPHSTKDTYVVVLDPGHGKSGTGAYRNYGSFVLDEAVINLKISQYTKVALEENYDNIVVYMTKTTQNENPSIADRVTFAARKNADILVSQHVNATADDRSSVNGVMAMVPTVNSTHSYHVDTAILSQKLARKILDQLVSFGFQDKNFFYKLSENNTLYEDGSLADYYGIVRECREINLPGVIIEHGFINNVDDAAKLNNEDSLKKIGEADARGIVEYLKEHAGYKDTQNNPSSPTPPVLVGPFIDVDPSMYYTDPILWAVDNNITTGTSVNTFEPEAACTRGQVVTFLYRTLGEPLPTTTVSPFIDVTPNGQINFYYDAVLWAYENHITTGTTDTTFEPDKTVSRAEFVTFLWRIAGEPTPTTLDNPFMDVNPTLDATYYYNAVLWAVENGITTGTSTTEFSPDDDCTRGQVVTFLYRTHANSHN